MQIETVPVSILSADPANARKHDEKNMAAIVASLRRFGQQKPIVVDSMNVVRAGNGTLSAAQKLGWETIDIVRTDLSGPDAVAFAIADNRTTDLSEFDDDILKAQLEALDDELRMCAGFDDVDLAGLGDSYSDEDLDIDTDDGFAQEYFVVVACKNEEHQKAIYNKLAGEGYEVQIRVS